MEGFAQIAQDGTLMEPFVWRNSIVFMLVFFISVLLVVFNPPGGRLDPWSLTFGLLVSVSTAHDGGRWGWIVASGNL